VSIEEIYFVLEGEITMKVGDDIVTLGPRDAILLPPQTPRATRNNGDVRAVYAMVSTKTEDPRAESVRHEQFWL
jgi:mannose-6-phosphate isomerase-like protein (cupin superfamily)